MSIKGSVLWALPVLRAANRPDIEPSDKLGAVRFFESRSAPAKAARNQADAERS